MTHGVKHFIPLKGQRDDNGDASPFPRTIKSRD
jgi:hypothetical protein